MLSAGVRRDGKRLRSFLPETDSPAGPARPQKISAVPLGPVREGFSCCLQPPGVEFGAVGPALEPAASRFPEIPAHHGAHLPARPLWKSSFHKWSSHTPYDRPLHSSSLQCRADVTQVIWVETDRLCTPRHSLRYHRSVAPQRLLGLRSPSQQGLCLLTLEFSAMSGYWVSEQKNKRRRDKEGRKEGNVKSFLEEVFSTFPPSCDPHWLHLPYDPGLASHALQSNTAVPLPLQL